MPIHSRFMFSKLKRWITHLLPTACILCRDPTAQTCNICLACQQDLPILPDHCPQCARFMVSERSFGIKGVPTPWLCGSCLKEQPPYSRLCALFPYEAPIIQLITQLKFQHQLSHAKAFGELLTEKIKDTWCHTLALPDVIIPIPLHDKRLGERGFNQAVEIARPIAKKLQIPLDVDGVRRRIATAPQSGLSAKDRKRNMAQAFSVQGNYRGLTVAVIDDVVTTGHTINEFCTTLKKSGVADIRVWCCARRG